MHEQVQPEGTPRVEIPDDTPEHSLEGKPKDGKVYLNDDGEKVKIDSRGRPYRIDERGFKKFRNSPRPDKYTPKDWQRIPHERRKEIIKVQEMEAGAERERRKVERKVKEAEDKAVEEKEKKDKSKKSSGSKDKGHGVGVSVSQDYVKYGTVFYYKLPHASVGSSGIASVVETDSSDTDIPGNDDFLDGSRTRSTTLNLGKWSRQHLDHINLETCQSPRITW